MVNENAGKICKNLNYWLIASIQVPYCYTYEYNCSCLRLTNEFLMRRAVCLKNWSTETEVLLVNQHTSNINSFVHLARRLTVLPAKAGLTTNERSDANKAL